MKRDLSELLLAAHVRELAKAVRSAKGQEEKRRTQPEESLNDFMAEYAKAHPVEEFVPEAMRLLESTCDAMRAYLTQPSETPALPSGRG